MLCCQGTDVVAVLVDGYAGSLLKARCLSGHLPKCVLGRETFCSSCTCRVSRETCTQRAPDSLGTLFYTHACVAQGLTL